MLTDEQLKLTLFDGFTEEELDELKRIIEVASFSAGEAILRQNCRATNLYIVVSGEVEITHKPYDAPEISVGKLSSGGVFGWSSILGREVYSSTVTAISPCSVYRLQAYRLQKFCELHHETGVVLLEKIALSVAQQPAKIHEQIMSMINLAMTCQDDN
jgi:CRP-like cAMP-binding protein